MEIPRGDFGDSLQLTNWILDSGETCNMTPNISDLMLVSVVEIDKYIKIADRNFFIEKQTGEVQIKMCDNSGKPFVYK